MSDQATAEVPAVAVRVAESAAHWIGTPYHPQASVCGVGCDCLGLIRGIWLNLYGFSAGMPPAYSADWAEAGADEALLAAADIHLETVSDSAISIGDVLVFRHRPGVAAKHCGIVSSITGQGRMIHALERRGVVEAPLGDWWLRRIAGKFRFPVLPR